MKFIPFNSDLLKLHKNSKCFSCKTNGLLMFHSEGIYCPYCQNYIAGGRFHKIEQSLSDEYDSDDSVDYSVDWNVYSDDSDEEKVISISLQSELNTFIWKNFKKNNSAFKHLRRINGCVKCLNISMYNAKCEHYYGGCLYNYSFVEVPYYVEWKEFIRDERIYYRLL